jgi:subtilase family serine protease
LTRLAPGSNRRGFTVNTVYNNKMLIDFSGDAGQIEAAFHTQIRNVQVGGENYVANSSDPQIPAALAGVVAGPLYLHNFRPQRMSHRVMAAHVNPKTGALVDTQYTPGNGYLPLVPYDLETIYDISPLLKTGISGQGMNIVVVEDTNLWNCNSTNTVGPCSDTSDWTVFRQTFGLNLFPAGNLAEENPGPDLGTSCTTPRTGPGYPSGSGINADDVESAIDVMWASSAAPSASLVSAACASPRGGFGGLTAIQNILNHPNADNVDVISMSYGESEELTGPTLNAAFNTTFQQAVAQGPRSSFLLATRTRRHLTATRRAPAFPARFALRTASPLADGCLRPTTFRSAVWISRIPT